MRAIGSIEELKGLAGREAGVSEWIEVTQERVNLFADATGDHQWIHVDPERCRKESPFGGPIAHGFLTLSLLPKLMESAVSLPPRRMGVNYGLNKVRFPAPVPVGSRVRARIGVVAVEDIAGGVQITWAVSMEREGGDKPVCAAESVTRLYV
jgi:acyl dehydratase